MGKTMTPKRTITGGLAAIVSILALTGCAKTVDADDLEGQLADELAPQAGLKVDEVSVDCPDDEEIEKGREFDCTLTTPEGDDITVTVTLTDDDGGFSADVPQSQFK